MSKACETLRDMIEGGMKGSISESKATVICTDEEIVKKLIIMLAPHGGQAGRAAEAPGIEYTAGAALPKPPTQSKRMIAVQDTRKESE